MEGSVVGKKKKKKKNFVVEELGEVRQAHPSRKVLLWASCRGFLVLHAFSFSFSFLSFFLGVSPWVLGLMIAQTTGKK